MFNNAKLSEKNGTSATVSIWDWILLDLLSIINIVPIIGTIVWLIIYAVIAFGSKTSPSMKNRILANLAWFVIGLIIFLVYLFALGGMAALSSLFNSAS